MSDRGLIRAAWALAVAAVVLSLTAAVFAGLYGDVVKAVASPLVMAFAVVGLVIVRAQPRNGVAWVFLVAGLLNCLNQFGDRLGTYALAHAWPEAIAHFAYWLTVLWFPGLFALITLGLLHFPNGRLPGRFWRWVDRISLWFMVQWTVFIGIAAWPVRARDLGGDAEPTVRGWQAVLFDIASAAVLLIVPCVLAAVVGLVLRWRRSRGVERLQIRWVAAAGVVAVGAEMALFALSVSNDVQTGVEAVGFSLIAVATGVAITRYRLYEIDRIVSRTLGYAGVTVLLAGTYVGIVAAAGSVIPARYGSVGVAGATLTVAALFGPVRRAVQARVDRRFDRARYNSARTVDAFRAAIRGGLEPDDLTDTLLLTVQRAVAPSSATMWLVPVAPAP